MTGPDVLVLGGGPAGAALASLVAGSGARVLVAERTAFPRDKVCGEFLSVEGHGVLDRLGILQSILDAGAPRMDSCRITSRNGTEVRASLPSIPGIGRAALGVSRRLLDAVLVDRARRAGAEVRERTVAVAPILEDGRVRGAVLRARGPEGGTREIRAPVVVAADGRRSVLVRSLHPELGDPSSTGPHSWFGLKCHLRLDGSKLGDRVELHQFDRGYAGLGMVETGEANLCLLATVDTIRACEGRLDRLLKRRLPGNPVLREILDGAERRSPWQAVGPLRFGVRRPVAAGALFVGDAAGTVDPFCGEGMAHALRGAELAAPFVLEAAARGELDPQLSGGYDDAWISAFARSTRRVRRLGWLMEHPWAAGVAVSAIARGGSRLLPSLVALSRTGKTAGPVDANALRASGRP